MPSARQIIRSQRIKSLPQIILTTLFVAGVMTISGQTHHLVRALLHSLKERDKTIPDDRKTNKSFSTAFNRVRRKGFLEFEKKGSQMYLRLTPEGKKKAGIYQIDDLEVLTPKLWDRKWRILIFDIPEQTRIKREALRGKLKELGFICLQKSVWVHAFPCHHELKLLKNFFGFTDHDYIYIETSSLGVHENNLKRRFSIQALDK